MKKFKRIFYPIYLLFALGFIYLSMDSLLNMEGSMISFNERFRVDRQPYWIMFFFLVLTVLMLIELIAENVHLTKVKKGMGEMEEEIVRLKAKLFDQIEEESGGEEGVEEEVEDDEDDED